MRKLVDSCLFTLAAGLFFYCDGTNLTKSQCIEAHNCDKNYDSCILKQAATANISSPGSSGSGVPATTFPPQSPSSSSESEPNDTFSQAFDSGVGIQSGPVDSYLLLATLTSSSDTDIFGLSPEYQVSVYFETQGTASCNIYWQNHYGIDIPNTSTPDGYFTFVHSLSDIPYVLENVSDYSHNQGGGFIFICSGSSASCSYPLEDHTPKLAPN